jgi:hypothetical protein
MSNIDELNDDEVLARGKELGITEWSPEFVRLVLNFRENNNHLRCK